MSRLPLATDLISRDGTLDQDAKLKNAYAEVRGEQSVVRHRPSARGGVSIGTGTAQGGIGINIGGTDYIYTVNGDVGALDTLATAGTNWASGTSYSIGDMVSNGFINYWALTDHSGSEPPSADWSTTYVPAVPFAGTYATWATGYGYTLSNGNLTASITSGSPLILFADRSNTSGKWYWEITINSFTGTNPTRELAVGFCDIGSTPNTQLGNDGDAYGRMYSDQSGSYRADKMNNGIPAAYGSNATVGSVVGVALDLTLGTITTYLNGVSEGVMFSGGFVGTDFIPAIGSNYCEYSITANFGASAFTYSVPSGYNRGFYTL